MLVFSLLLDLNNRMEFFEGFDRFCQTIAAMVAASELIE